MPTAGDAFLFLQTVWAPEFYAKNGWKDLSGGSSMLYVGHRLDTAPWWHDTFAKICGIKRLAVIDIVEGNARSADQITKEIYVGDVRTYPVPPFDLVFWDEGPEHMPKDESLWMITQMARSHAQVLISCPWGYQPQGSDPSDFEFHHWGPQPEDFQAIGMEARTFGTMFDGHGHGHGNLIAWTP